MMKRKENKKKMKSVRMKKKNENLISEKQQLFEHRKSENPFT